MSRNIWHAIISLLHKIDVAPPNTIWCCSLIQPVLAFMLLCFMCHCKNNSTVCNSNIYLPSLKRIILSQHSWSLCGDFICEGLPKFTGIMTTCLFLPVENCSYSFAVAFNSLLMCVKLMFESGLIQQGSSGSLHLAFSVLPCQCREC